MSGGDWEGRLGVIAGASIVALVVVAILCLSVIMVAATAHWLLSGFTWPETGA